MDRSKITSCSIEETIVMPIGITTSIIVRVRGIVDASIIGLSCQRNNCEIWNQTFIPKTSLLGSH
jgi:hypothetical protein